MNQDFATSTELLKHVFSEITGRYAMFKTWSLVHTNIYSLHVHRIFILKKSLNFLFQEQTTYFVGFLYSIKKCIIEWNCFSLISLFIYLFIHSTFYQIFTKWVSVYWVCIKQSVTCICMFGRVPIYCELIIVSEGQMPDREFTSLRTYLQATEWYLWKLSRCC